MASDEYQIPNNYSEPEIRAEIDAIEYAQASPENNKTPFQVVKDVEARVFSRRDAALNVNVEKKPKGWLNGLVFQPQNNTIRELIDEESKRGGKLFGEGHRFWLDAKSDKTIFHNDVADWYHLQVNPINPKHPTVLRFQTTPNSFHKLYEGREYTPTPQDIETFVQAVEAYANAVEPLYSDNL